MKQSKTFLSFCEVCLILILLQNSLSNLVMREWKKVSLCVVFQCQALKSSVVGNGVVLGGHLPAARSCSYSVCIYTLYILYMYVIIYIRFIYMG